MSTKSGLILILLALTAALPGASFSAQNTVTVGGTTYAVGEGQGDLPPTEVIPAAQAPSPQKLQQMVAPIALYPDVLVTQILIGCTYPTQVVEAYEWLQKYQTASAAQAQSAGQEEGWDPSVVSLLQFPTVLTRMFQNLEWSQDLGQAFNQDKQGVMGAIQTMRAQAAAAGNLNSSSQQTVAQQGTTIIIEPAQTQVVYVPAYDPAVVYGAWVPGPWYYPPAVYAPWYGYMPGRALAFGVGVAVGAAWSDAWHCDWAHGNVYVNNNYYHGYHTADGAYHGYNGSAAHYGNTTAAYNRNTGEVHSYNSATGVERSGQAYQGAYGSGVKGENGSVAHAGNTTASYNKNTGEMHSYNSATGNAHYGNVDNAARGYGGGGEHTGGGWGGGGGGWGGGGGGWGGADAAASSRGWASRGGGGGGGGFHGGGRR